MLQNNSQAQSCLFLFLTRIVPNFILFLAAKITFDSWHVETHGIHTGFSIFGSEERRWQISAIIKVWHDPCQN